MPEVPGFQRKQYAFAAHIRDPEKNAAPGQIEDRRMAIYRELFFNNLFNLLSSTFPVLKKLHADERWRALIREFMIRHQARTPYFLEIPREFLNFLETEHQHSADDFPFLQELAHYEWAELALSVAEEQNDFSGIDPEGDLLRGVPVKSVLAWAFSYRFPVHRISQEYQPQEAGEQPTHLAIFRNADDELGFMELNSISARLLQMIGDNAQQLSGRDLLLQLAGETNYADPEVLVTHGAAAMQQMRATEILLGVART
ncbi:MAG: DUF2063 domain-containing protein [Gammaproteobacteria bacterium]|nr:MAG: DUF2063 domain-containing protein [Gammaproteobacteria bacterium]